MEETQLLIRENLFLLKFKLQMHLLKLESEKDFKLKLFAQIGFLKTNAKKFLPRTLELIKN